MRHFLLFTIFLFSMLWLQLSGQNFQHITGQVSYLNNASTPLYNVEVQLKTIAGQLVQTTNTDYLGHFSFWQDGEGTYLIALSSTREVGSINSNDALLALKHYVEQIALTGLKYQAGDVNGNNFINSVDALLILRRYVELVQTFTVGEWVFEETTFSLAAGGVIDLQIKGLCYGDIDASFTPAGCAPMPTPANAGPDQNVEGVSTSLEANTPVLGTGVWDIITGDGGVFAEPANPTSEFSGLSSITYTLTWTITTVCASSIDTVVLTFTEANTGIPCPDQPYFEYGGQTYNTVQIGTQCWMKENLNIGSMIVSTSSQSNNGTIEKFCHGNTLSNCEIFGGLYQWDEMMQYNNGIGFQGICPCGWHIPTDAEWCELTSFLDPDVNCLIWSSSGTVVGAKMKETGLAHWADPNTGATNESGFTALGGGYCHTNGTFASLSGGARFWASESFASNGISRYLSNFSTAITRYNGDYKNRGLSVRCIKN